MRVSALAITVFCIGLLLTLLAARIALRLQANGFAAANTARVRVIGIGMMIFSLGAPVLTWAVSRESTSAWIGPSWLLVAGLITLLTAKRINRFQAQALGRENDPDFALYYTWLARLIGAALVVVGAVELATSLTR